MPSLFSTTPEQQPQPTHLASPLLLFIPLPILCIDGLLYLPPAHSPSLFPHALYTPFVQLHPPPPSFWQSGYVIRQGRAASLLRGITDKTWTSHCLLASVHTHTHTQTHTHRHTPPPPPPPSLWALPGDFDKNLLKRASWFWTLLAAAVEEQGSHQAHAGPPLAAGREWGGGGDGDMWMPFHWPKRVV